MPPRPWRCSCGELNPGPRTTCGYCDAYPRVQDIGEIRCRPGSHFRINNDISLPCDCGELAMWQPTRCTTIQRLTAIGGTSDRRCRLYGEHTGAHDFGPVDWTQRDYPSAPHAFSGEGWWLPSAPSETPVSAVRVTPYVPATNFYILDAGVPMPESDSTKWHTWMSHAQNRVVASDEVMGCVVSTVFIGVNVGSPTDVKLWETLTINQTGKFEKQHWRSYQEALDGHRRTVASLTAARGIRLR